MDARGRGERPLRRLELELLGLAETAFLRLDPADVPGEDRRLRPVVVLRAIREHGHRRPRFRVEGERDLFERIPVGRQPDPRSEPDRALRPDPKERFLADRLGVVESLEKRRRLAAGRSGRDPCPSSTLGDFSLRRFRRRPRSEEDRDHGEKCRAEEEDPDLEPLELHGAGASSPAAERSGEKRRVVAASLARTISISGRPDQRLRESR